MARQMVINYGMSDIGPWSLLDPSAQSGDMVMRMMARNSMSENLQQRIDGAVKKLAVEAYEVAVKQISDNREAIDKIVEVLMEKETISGDEFRAMLSGARALVFVVGRRRRGVCAARSAPGGAGG